MPTAWDQSCGTTAPAPRRGGSAGAVVEASEGADLLVLGRHKQRTNLGPRLGPVTQASVHQSRCPVVVPHDRAEPAGEAGEGSRRGRGDASGLRLGSARGTPPLPRAEGARDPYRDGPPHRLLHRE
ncbi:universal stress protein [Streptomyces europaeiscabiei]|nr:universal stress protein [Streptomyces europaeiscabiei]MDX3778371.1 universal stress protein [Streptomyces europaeiscabiei]